MLETVRDGGKLWWAVHGYKGMSWFEGGKRQVVLTRSTVVSVCVCGWVGWVCGCVWDGCVRGFSKTDLHVRLVAHRQTAFLSPSKWSGCIQGMSYFPTCVTVLIHVSLHCLICEWCMHDRCLWSWGSVSAGVTCHILGASIAFLFMSSLGIQTWVQLWTSSVTTLFSSMKRWWLSFS